MTDKESKIREYKQRQERKKERFAELAEKHTEKAESRYQAFRAIGDRIPMGQPILVGHHSERGHRADLKRMDSHMKKLSEHLEASKHYEKKIEKLENNKSLFSDDPELLEKVSDRLAGLIALREAYKAFNKTMKAMGLEQAIANWPGDKDRMRRTVESYKRLCEGTGKLPSFLLTNLGAKIRRYESKKDWAEKITASEPQGFTLDTVTVEFSDGYWIAKFPLKPSDNIRSKLKRAPLVLKWSRTRTAWVRRHTESCGQYFIEQLKLVIQEYNAENVRDS